MILVCIFISLSMNFHLILIFQVRLYRFSLTNNQTYDSTNINSPSNSLFSYPFTYNNEYYNNEYNGYSSSDYSLSGNNYVENCSTYDISHRCNWNRKGERQMYHSNTNSPNTEMYPFPYNNKRIRELITPERQSYPRPFRTSTSAGALIQGSYNSSNVLSPSSDYSLKSVHHIIGKKQNCSKDVNGYQSLPTITTSNGVERRNKTQSLVV